VNPFLALIVPASGSPVDPGYTPPGVVAPPGGRPPGSRPPTGGQPQPPHPDNTLPGALPHPEHPIFYPLPPGAPVDPEYGVPIEHPDQGLPGSPPKPDQGLPGGSPGAPAHPIVLPPDAGGGWGPIYIWGGGPGARPPIALPPDGQQPEGKVEWKAVWTPANGWQTIGIVVPGMPAPTPSKK
jgi:hypothetical protein